MRVEFTLFVLLLFQVNVPLKMKVKSRDVVVEIQKKVCSLCNL